MDLIRKVIESEVKKVGEGIYEFTASTEDKDRDGEIIEVAGWDLKNFKKNPVIMYGHDYKGLPIGKAPRIWRSEGVLKNTVEFPPEGTYEFADIVHRLVDKGFLKTESVGFMPQEWEDGDGDKAPRRTYKKQELLEISIVPVPSNPNALADAVEAGVITTKELDIINKPEETDDFIRIPVRDCKVTATIDISKKEGISALYCGKEKQVRTYLFDKRAPYNWTMAKAKKWVEEHDGKGFTGTTMTDSGDFIYANSDTTYIPKENPQPKEKSQEEIKDEIDYAKSLIEDGLSAETQEEAWELVREIMRLHGNDIPFDILEKVGAVLSAKNKTNLKEAQRLIQTVIDSAETESIAEPKEVGVKPTLELEQLIEIVKHEVGTAIRKAQGAVD